MIVLQVDCIGNSFKKGYTINKFTVKIHCKSFYNTNILEMLLLQESIERVFIKEYVATYFIIRMHCQRFGFVSLFNDTSTFVGCLMSKPSL